MFLPSPHGVERVTIDEVTLDRPEVFQASASSLGSVG